LDADFTDVSILDLLESIAFERDPRLSSVRQLVVVDLGRKRGELRNEIIDGIPGTVIGIQLLWFLRFG
jgi:hypothetical protein